MSVRFLHGMTSGSASAPVFVDRLAEGTPRDPFFTQDMRALRLLPKERGQLLRICALAKRDAKAASAALAVFKRRANEARRALLTRSAR